MIKDLLEAVEINCTCGACPTQYEIKLTDGRMIYVRYRWGYLSIRISKEKTEIIRDAVNGEEIFGEQIGDDLHGILSEGQIYNYLGIAGIVVKEITLA